MGAVAETEDLEALFDRVAAQGAIEREVTGSVEAAGSPACPAACARDSEDAVDPGHTSMFNRVGQLTRTLHDALRELGYDRSLEKAVQSIPDARDRLNYIATLTGQAAEKALGAVERAQAVQQDVSGDAVRLGGEWERAFAGTLSIDEFKRLAAQTREHFAVSARRSEQTRAELHEIMMAQDFHDLTGQIINRVVGLAQGMEAQLLQLLVEARSAAASSGSGVSASDEWLTGPAMNAHERSDVVANQAQVDELLESLGF